MLDSRALSLTNRTREISSTSSRVANCRSSEPL
jgi:hypothetical protein